MKTIKERRAEQRERSVTRIMTTCAHFTGIQHDTCKAGVNYHVLCGTGAGCFAKLPCTHDDGSVICELRKFPTRDEAEKQETENQVHLAKTLQAVATAHEDAKNKGLSKGHGGQGEVKCPHCTDGMIRYSVASCNGHMHAGCTKGCVSWME